MLCSIEETVAQAGKGESMRMHVIPLSRNKDKSANASNRPLIGFVSLFVYDKSEPEIKKAFDELLGSTDYQVEFLSMKELEKQSKKIARFSVIWVHRTDTTALSSVETGSKVVQILKSYVQNGGNLFLTMQAMHYLNVLEIEPMIVQDSTKPCFDIGYGRRLGFHSFRDHPVFTGMNGGAYTCRATSDITTRIAGFFGDNIPHGKVVAVDWDDGFLREDTKLVIEYTSGKGRVLAVGGYMNFSLLNSNEAHLKVFTKNCLLFLLNHFTGLPAFYWDYMPRQVTVCHSWNDDLDAITNRDQSGDLNVMIGGRKKPVNHLSGQFDGFRYVKRDSSFQGIPTGKIQIAGMLCYKLEINDNLDVVFSASSEGYESTYAQFNKTIQNPAQVFRNANQHSMEILSKSLVITTPDLDFNAGYRWALLSNTRHDWGGDQKLSGSPCYGRCFENDAVWSSLTLLDYGDFGKIKSQLEFFNKYQDLSGKILDEASTSGVIHCDAADATPLYIVLAGKYFRHTNDTTFLRETWPNVKHAIDFCLSPNTDHAHLIKNTNLGHGWIEGGELYGSHSTIYMAGSWGAALIEASNMARFIPTNYHYGSVCPLFTSWVSLAEYATGNSIQGFSHLMNNMNVYKNWAPGLSEEVLNGSGYQPSGVCAHQCLSGTMVLQPAIEGMLGLEIKAQERKIILAPKLPPQWDSLDIQHIRMAEQFVDLHFKRKSGVSEYQFTLDMGQPIQLEFMPDFPAGTRFIHVTLNGKVVPYTSFKSAQSMTLIVSFELASASTLVVKTEAGISVLPCILDPKPGDEAGCTRILSTLLSGNNYQVEVEGKSGSSGILRFWSGGQDLLLADNARFLDQNGRVFRFAVDFDQTEKPEKKYMTKKVTITVK